MKLFVGLGNPGAKYELNRHNIGFLAVERIASEHGFGPWRAKHKGLVSEGMIGGEKVLLLKPQTYMNESGQSVGEAARFHKIAPTDIVIFHDELDLAPGKVKVKQGGGSAGHNGLRSIDAHVGNDTLRVRLGIGHPGSKEAVVHYVLNDFAKSERAWLDALLDDVAKAAPLLAVGDNARFLNAVAQAKKSREPTTADADETRSARVTKRPSGPAKNEDANAMGRQARTNVGPQKGEGASKRAGALAHNLAKWLSARKPKPAADEE